MLFMRSAFLFLIFFSSLSFAESLTSKNIEGQKNLFKYGWEIITSPVEAWNTAIKNNESSKEAFVRVVQKIKLDKETSSQRLDKASNTISEMNMKADSSSKDLIEKVSRFQQKSFEASSENFQKAWKKISLGYLSFRESNEDDLKALKEINTEFFGRVNSHFKTMDEAIEPVMGHLLVKSEVAWMKYFKEGKYAFEQQYEKSGTRGNSLTGLWDILVGYASWTYKAVVKPTSKAVYNNVKSIPYYSVDLILKTFIASTNVVHSLGANIYYSTKLGYKVISPSLEAGYLSGLALINAINGGVTSNALRTAGIINKVAIKGSAPVAGASQLVFEEVASKASDAATVLLYGSQAVGEVVFEKVETGVILGYSALSQIPPQLLLTAMNSAIFIVYDGPKLLLVKVTGKLGDKEVDELPVGTVLDLKKAKEVNLRVEPFSDDPEVIKKVLQHVD